jgi:hypothetical protein
MKYATQCPQCKSKVGFSIDLRKHDPNAYRHTRLQSLKTFNCGSYYILISKDGGRFFPDTETVKFEQTEECKDQRIRNVVQQMIDQTACKQA